MNLIIFNKLYVYTISGLVVSCIYDSGLIAVLLYTVSFTN